MSLKNPVVPKRIRSELVRALPSLYQFLRNNPQVGVHHRDIQRLQVQLWLPVYVGTLEHPKPKRKEVKPKLRLSTKRVAWLCFLKTRKGVNAALEFKAEKSRSVQHQFQQGDPIRKTFAHVKAARRSPRLKRASYTARLLNIPGLYFNGLWLRSASRELYVSLVRVGNELRAGHFYTRSEIVEALKDELTRRKEAHRVILARKREVANATEDETSR